MLVGVIDGPVGNAVGKLVGVIDGAVCNKVIICYHTYFHLCTYSEISVRLSYW